MGNDLPDHVFRICESDFLICHHFRAIRINEVNRKILARNQDINSLSKPKTEESVEGARITRNAAIGR
ncbi:MAG: hypothetical protein COV95_02175 [Candidatus Zambryskibacteria bacterium CG11_big_fil_rev_8_21_14_0_20_40_24]|uniref:Uncharacterized protein n=1 Tax=Candidatus Zambryskibacteria bacterium CG11_big_fil_rev_8_21_14_0_20_40_24 TaxID=1975116 RepID=A0A2H0K6C3_9BACT|nr:MAG: hypothetical protein COV95_02175 [Candidatus Zambryskibacteria bacterium CG11_big_fil_rev_8_21_14_0_20_40_24]